MSETIAFELVSPEEKLVSEPVSMAVVPGEEGQFGVLPGHSSLVASLKAGVVELSLENGDSRNIFIAGGFADVTPGLCSILAEEAVNVSDLDKGALEQELANLNSDLNLASEDTDKARILKKTALVEAKLDALAA